MGRGTRWQGSKSLSLCKDLNRAASKLGVFKEISSNMERTLGNSPRKGGRGLSGNTQHRDSMSSRQSAPKGSMTLVLSRERRIYISPQDTLLQDSLERWGSLSHTVRAGSPSKGVLANIDRAGRFQGGAGRRGRLDNCHGGPWRSRIQIPK